MKKRYAFFIALMPLIVQSQSFNNNTWTPIPNDATDLMIPITVAGLPSNINSAYGLSSVCFTITHEYDANLRIRLQSPDGTTVLLVDQKGANENNFLYTCLHMDASGGSVNNAPAPFTGNYLPQESLNNFNNQQNPNGTWYLILTDLFVPSDTGSFHFGSIMFQNNPPPDPSVSGPCNNSNPGGCECPDGSSDCDLLPDISASELSMIQDHHEYNGRVTVGVATPNIGWGPLEINGTPVCYCDSVQVPCTTTQCPNGDTPKQMVNQRIYHRSGNTMTTWDRPAGTMSYHPSHGHIHIDNWLDYTIRVSTPNPDARTWPIVGRGDKQSFCLINLSDCDSWFGFCVDSAGNNLHVADLPNANFGSVSGCGTSQGIYVGNIDEYNSTLNGNGILIPAACNQQYYIVAIIDPLNNLLETNKNNNWAAVPITLTMQNAGQLEPSGFVYSINGSVVSFFANALAPDSLVWQWGDGTSSTTSTVITDHTYSSPGTYIVWLYAYNHCGPTVSADTIVVLPTGITETRLESDHIFLQPNPVRDIAKVVYSLKQQGRVTVDLYNLSGKAIRNLVNENKSAGNYYFSLDVKKEELSAGVYYLKFNTQNTSGLVRIIVL